MKGLRWILAFLRDPVVAVGSAVDAIRDRIARRAYVAATGETLNACRRRHR